MIKIQKNILIIGADEATLYLIEECKKKNLNIILTDKNPNSLGVKYADKFYNCNGLDKEKILEISRENNIDGIITLGEDRLGTIAYVCEKLNLPGINENAVIYSQDKYKVRKVMEENGFFTPKYFISHCWEDLEKRMPTIEFPVVIKPVDCAGGVAVKRANNETELKEDFYEAYEASKNKTIIIEELILGQEYSVEAITQNNLTEIVSITEKSTGCSPYFIEKRHLIPASLNKDATMEIESVVKKLINLLEFNNCGSHTELKITNKGVAIIETSARLGGDFITTRLVPLSTGFSIYSAIVGIAIGENVIINKNLNKVAAIQYIVPENYKNFKENEEFISNNSNVLCVKELNSIKEKKVIKHNPARLGYFICCCETREEIDAILNKID